MIDLAFNFFSLPERKIGKPLHIRLNAVEVAALKMLERRSLDGEGRVFVNIEVEKNPTASGRTKCHHKCHRLGRGSGSRSSASQLSAVRCLRCPR
jgi:hypothetical protein